MQSSSGDAPAGVTIAPPRAASGRSVTLRRLPAIDGLRAISVLAVIVYHYFAIGGRTAGPLPGGYLGVEVFFVVSGYLITSLLLAERRRSGSVSLRNFWKRRARRLFPALWTLLAVVVAYSLLFLPDSISALKGDVVAALTYTSNWWQLIAGHSYFETTGRPELLKHLWSLAIEEQFYLVWPIVLMFALRKWGRSKTVTATIAVALLSSVWMAILAQHSQDRAYYGTDTRLSGLLLGSALAFAFAPQLVREARGRGARLVLDVMAVVGVAVLVWSFVNLAIDPGSTADVFRGGFLLVDVATLLVIVAVVNPVARAGRVLAWAPLEWIGLRSYSLYLWHYPIFCITRPGGTGDGGDFQHFFQLHGWPVFVVRFGLAFGAAELSYRFIEMPIRQGALGRYFSTVKASRGTRRLELATRGVAVGTAALLTAGVLATQLAAAQPKAVSIPGVASSAHGLAADRIAPDILKQIKASSTTTTAPTTTPTATTAPAATTAAGQAAAPNPAVAPPTPAPTAAPTAPPAPALPPGVLAVGDSVMLGARNALGRDVPGIRVDAVVSRQFAQAISLLQQYASFNAIPGTVVVHLGTNGAFSDAQFDQMMNVLGPQRRVFFVTAREPRVWEGTVNARLVGGAQRHANVKVIDWHGLAAPHTDWFVNDGIHLNNAGQQAYADLIRDSIAAP